MGISPIKTPETPHPVDMNAQDALYCLEATEACIDAIAMEYNIDGSISIPLVTLATSNLHVAQTYLMALILKDKEEDIPF